MPIAYRGGKVAGTAGQGGGSIAINSGLTGGSGSAALAGDLVVVTVSIGTAARQPTTAISTPTGYTPLTAQRTTATNQDTNVQTCYKIMGGTPDTAVTIPASGNNADGIAYAIQVFSGVDPTTPMDVSATYATGSGTDDLPDGASITPTTHGAALVVCGGGASATGANYTAAALTNFLTAVGQDTNDGTVGVGYTLNVSGLQNPAKFGGGSVNAANSWGCSTLALRPLATSAAIAETGSAADATTAPTVFTPAVAEAGSSSDSATGSLVTTSALAETGSSADSVTGERSFSVDSAEAGSSSEEVTGLPELLGAVSESGSSADSLTGLPEFPGDLTESGSSADEVTSILEADGSLVESGSTSEDVDGEVPDNVVVLEEAGVADAATSGVLVAVSALSESGSISDTVDSTTGYLSSLIESGASAEVIAQTAALLGASVEALAAVDVVGGPTDFQLGLIESGLSEESITGTLVFSVDIDEASSASDVQTGGLARGGILIESASLSDLMAVAVIALSRLAESQSTLDALEATANFIAGLEVAEAGSLSDASTVSLSFIDSLLESGYAEGYYYGGLTFNLVDEVLLLDQWEATRIAIGIVTFEELAAGLVLSNFKLEDPAPPPVVVDGVATLSNQSRYNVELSDSEAP